MGKDKPIMLITGASGRIGKLCVHRFADEYHVVGFDRHEHDHEKEMTHINMDISSDESVKNALDEVKNRFGSNIGPVIHLAAYYSFSNQRPELYDTITVQGTRRLLEELHTFDSVEQFHFSSTLLVHAPCKVGQTINEDSPLQPKWDYPKSKVKTEKVIEELHGDIPAVVMRIAGCYDDMCHSIPIAHNIQRIYQHELNAHLYPGDTSHGNPFLHMDDLINAYALAIKKVGTLPNHLTLLIGEDKTASYKELQYQISEIVNHKDFHMLRVPKWLAKEGAWVESKLPFFDDNFIQPWMVDLADDHYQLDISRAKKMIGWTPKHFVIDSLPIMMELLKSDPIRWYQENELVMPVHLKKHIESHAK
ncbi:MAG: NAD(P)-dependent oxidoreductase [Chlamydiia bacterium]|nr:NAD(P)-dependent oxidoreductase [Chlamydiia bacterium]